MDDITVEKLLEERIEDLERDIDRRLLKNEDTYIPRKTLQFNIDLLTAIREKEKRRKIKGFA